MIPMGSKTVLTLRCYNDVSRDAAKSISHCGFV